VHKRDRSHASDARLPTHAALQREVAYANTLQLTEWPKPTKAMAFAAGGLLLWGFFEWSLIMAQSTHKVDVSYSQGALQLVVVDVGNDAQNVNDRNLQKLGPNVQSPCQRVTWTAGEHDQDVTLDLAIERCYGTASVPPDVEQRRTTLAEGQVAVWVSELEAGHGHNNMTVFTRKQARMYVFQTNVFRAQDPQKTVVQLNHALNSTQLAAMEPFFHTAFTKFGCQADSFKEDTHLSDNTAAGSVAMCPAVITDIWEQLLSVMADRVDLPVAPGGADFSSALQDVRCSSTNVDLDCHRTQGASRGGGHYEGTHVKVGQVQVPWLNLLWCIVVGATGVIGYLVLAHVPIYDLTAKFLDNHAAAVELLK
jgi:hypothetical protein